MTGTVVVVTNIPRPYRQALFSVLKQKMAADGLTLRVLYTSDPSKHARRGSPSVMIDDEVESYVQGISFRTAYERVIAFPTGLRRALRERRPSCVVAGGFGPSAIAAALWCRRAGIPYVLWSGAWPGREEQIGRIQVTVRKWLVRNARAFIAYGSAAADYLVNTGASSRSVFCAWNTVDLEGIASLARAAARRRHELTGKYQLADRNLLYVGTLVESKGVFELVAAALAAQPDTPDWALHFVGTGPAREQLEQTVRVAGADIHFRFHGLRPPHEVAELLGVADALLLPTKQEVWGLVINEAMACGLPLVASPWAGATRDLIVDGVTGYVVEPSDTARMAEVMSVLLVDEVQAREMGRAGAEAVRARASLDRSADGFVSAVRCALEIELNGQE